MSEERVVEALRALRDADRDVEAGPEVEVRLMRAVVARRRAGRVWIGAGAAAIAAAAGFVMLHPRRTEPIPQAPPPVIAVAAPSPPAVVEAVLPKPRPARRKPGAPQEVTTGFYPLMELAPPFERGELVRMTVPASTMRDVGIFVNASHLDDPVQADVLIGQEGLARAIRFVSYQ
jgi:hypothetical protein